MAEGAPAAGDGAWRRCPVSIARGASAGNGVRDEIARGRGCARERASGARLGAPVASREANQCAVPACNAETARRFRLPGDRVGLSCRLCTGLLPERTSATLDGPLHRIATASPDSYLPPRLHNAASVSSVALAIWARPLSAVSSAAASPRRTWYTSPDAIAPALAGGRAVLVCQAGADRVAAAPTVRHETAVPAHRIGGGGRVVRLSRTLDPGRQCHRQRAPPHSLHAQCAVAGGLRCHRPVPRPFRHRRRPGLDTGVVRVDRHGGAGRRAAAGCGGGGGRQCHRLHVPVPRGA
eukprot:ctg_2761.g473